MARPLKQVVDYFPHMVNHGKTILILRNEFGNDGYAFWFSLLELLCKADGQYYDYNNPAAWRLLLAETHVKGDIANSILSTLAEVEAIDRELYENKVIWVQNLVDNLDQVYDRRTTGKPSKPSYCQHNAINNPINADNNSVNGNSNPASKLNNTKLNNILSEKAIELATLLKELIISNNPKALLKENVITTWGKTFDLMLTKDKRDPKDIEAVIRWAQADDFEKANVLSAEKVRSRFDALYLKMNAKNNGHNKQQAPVSMYKYVNEEAKDDN